MSTDEQTPVINRVSPKIPDFWPASVSLWVAQCKAQFRTANITSSQTKFDYAVQKLGESTANRLQDLILNPPATQPFEALVERLAAGFEKSIYERLVFFNALPPLGDRRPSELADAILASLAGIGHDSSSCPHVLHAFLSRLPEAVRVPLIDLKFENIQKLAVQADKVWSSVDRPAPSTLSVLADDAVQPEPQLVAAVQDPRRRPLQQQQQQQPARRHQQAPHVSDRRLCWYHARFASRATRCQAPCDWVPAGNGSAGGRRN